MFCSALKIESCGLMAQGQPNHYMTDKYFFPRELVVRTAGYPFNSRFDEATIRESLLDPYFLEAIYLASPDLYDESIKWLQSTEVHSRKGEKILHTLVKYYSRISSRCTPFGLFAGCSVAQWGEPAPFLPPDNGKVRNTRLDMQYLCALSRKLAAIPAVRARLAYSPNTSIHHTGSEVRFVEDHYLNDGANAQLSSVMASEYLLEALRASALGMPIIDIAMRLTTEDVDAEQARDFVEQLIVAQVLVSELDPSVTGTDYFARILDVLGNIESLAQDPETTSALLILTGVQARLKALDRATGNPAEAYEQIAAALVPLAVPFQRSRLFYVNLTIPAGGGVVDRQLQASIAEALEVLGYFAPIPKNETLEIFKKQFIERYEGREMPLLEVLDTEGGIGYANKGKDGHTPFVSDLLVPSDQAGPVINWGGAQQWLFEKLREVQHTGSYQLALSRDDLPRLACGPLLLPPSTSVVFRLVDDHTVVLEGVGGSSGINLLGRFAHFDPEIEVLARHIAGLERNSNPGVILAEIVHLPESRTGNILLRPVLRDFEIPYLAQSVLPPESQIPLSDLLVSVHDNNVVIRSRKLNKRVVPRLGTAHNYLVHSIPVYHFLCDLQSQGFQSELGFNWDLVFPNAKFTPRLTYENVVLHLATWQLQRQDYHDIAHKADEMLPAGFRVFAKKWNLPRFFTLADGDNELLVDAENALTVQTFVGTIKQRNAIQLKEFLFTPHQSPVRDARGRPYVHQFIASFVRRDACYTAEKAAVTPGPVAMQREFWPGTEWLYYKLYCGVNTSDQVLPDIIRPLAEELVAARLIDKWFFVRFSDPHNHLRVRFHLSHAALLGETLRVIAQRIQPYLDAAYIWKSQLDTYSRELERYGHQTMEMTETLFFHDSVAVVNVLAQIQAQEQEDLRWLYGLKSVDELLNAFSYSLPEKLRLMQQVQEAFAREFRLDKPLKLQLDAKYRMHKAAIRQVLRGGDDVSAESAALLEPLRTRNGQIAHLASAVRRLEGQNQLNVPLDSLLTSYIHMTLNRLIGSNQRLHEMVIYDFLKREYKAASAMLGMGM